MNNIFYPKQILKTKITTLENQCFFAMPFSADKLLSTRMHL